MKNYLTLYFIFISTIFGNKIIHEKVQSASYGISVPIKAFLNVSETNVHRFSLLYRPIGNTEFIETPLIHMGNSIYLSEIPGDFLKRDVLEYYLLLEMKNHSLTKFPTLDANENPIRVKIELRGRACHNQKG